MTEKDIRIVKLEPMRVACVNGFGESPEGQAFDKIKAWAKAHNLFDQPSRLFGYNNPNPAPGSPNYGYDVWMTVDETVKVDGEAREIRFPGGLYAVTRCPVKDPMDGDIGRSWKKLVTWREQSKYQHGCHQWLEEHIGSLAEMDNNQNFTLDLYLPIRE
jgi:DNA gyrase inhibitor GyrI